MFSKITIIFRRLRAIATTTVTELYGQPVVMLLVLGGIIAASLIPYLQLHSFGEAGRLARDGGLAYQLVIGLVLAVVSASASIHDEVASGTAAAALAKPVSRNLFIVGKWLGVMCVTFRFWFCMLATTMLAERIAERVEKGGDYITDKPVQFLLFLIPVLSLTIAGYLHNRKRIRFCKTTISLLTEFLLVALVVGFFVNRRFEFAPSWTNVNLHVIPVSLLVLFSLGIFSSIASALVTRLRTSPAMVICLALLLLGLSSDTMLSSTAPGIVRAVAVLVPNLQSFWMCDAIASGGTLPFAYLFFAAVYAVALIAVALGAAMLAFKGKDLP